MKKQYLIIFALLFSIIATAQKGDKLKGNKILETKTTEIPSYKILEIGEEFEVVLVEQKKPRVVVETDSNFHEYINIDVKSEKLKIQTTANISRNKKLYLEIGCNDSIALIVVNDKAKLSSSSTIRTERTKVIANNSAKVAVDFISDRIELVANGKGKISSTINAESIEINGAHDSNITTDVVTESLNIILNDDAEVNIAGTSSKTISFLQGKSDLNAANLSSAIFNLDSKDSSKSTIKVTDKLTINNAGSPETKILGNPLFEISGFNDESKLIKLKKAPSNAFKKLLN